MTESVKKPPRTKNFLAQAASDANLTFEAYTSVRKWIAEQMVADEYAKLGQGGHTMNQVPLRQVFVDLPVVDNLSLQAPHDQRSLFLQNILSAKPIILSSVCTPRGKLRAGLTDIADKESLEKGKSQIPSRSTQEFSFSATLLIGGPGQGKSTLGQLACQLHRAALLKPVEGELVSTQRELVQSFDLNPKGHANARLRLPKKPFLPLQVALPDLAVWLAKDNSTTQGEQVPSILRFLADLPSAKTCDLTAQTLLDLAISLPTLLVLDGFDEVGATQDRERLVAAARNLLTRLAESNGLAQVIATTRPQGYAGELAQIGC